MNLKFSSTLDEVPEAYRENDGFSAFFAGALRANFTEEEEMQYTKDMMTENDIWNSKREACIKAKAEGAAESKLEIARKMKELEVDSAIIAQGTGLTAAEVEAHVDYSLSSCRSGRAPV